MKICFFCKIKDKELLKTVEFYNQDIIALRKLDKDLQIATKYSEINWSADIIYIWWWTYALLPALFFKILGKKVIICGTFNYKCQDLENDFYKRPFWQRILIKSAFNIANLNILVSRLEYNLILNDWNSENIVYSPHCIDTLKYFPNREEVAEEFVFSLCWSGKLNLIRKGIYESLEAIELLKKRGVNIKLKIAGHKGDGYSGLVEFINKKGLYENIVLLGEISEETKIKYLQECFLYLQPSKYEGFGLAIAEAMSCGGAVIVTNVGEVPNVVKDAAIIIESSEPLIIANTIEKLLKEKETVKLLRSKARIRIQEAFAIERRELDIQNFVNQLFKKDS